MGVCVRGRRCCKGWPTTLYPYGVTTGEAKHQALIGTVKGRSRPTFTCLPYSSHDVPTIAQDTITISKMVPMIVVGLL
jgi:hypothetical protein